MADKDAQEVKEILEAVSETVPKLLNEITETLFNPERTKEFGKTVAEFYKTMVESGMPPEQAFELTKKFMDSSSPGSMISQALGGIGGGDSKVINIGGGHGPGPDFDDDIEKKIKEKMEKKGLNIKID
ncbi:MAG: hypothetical protein KAS67_06925 [Thermoplasmata archaeon]|nr:hypothetical protein [Thermoplasmata archaeon]